MLDGIGAQIQTERIVPFKIQTERIILVENSIGIQGGLKRTPLKNESGSYSLILQSKLESAKAFEQWVTKDVLPSIRKTGMIEIGVQIQTEQNGPP